MVSNRIETKEVKIISNYIVVGHWPLKFVDNKWVHTEEPDQEIEEKDLAEILNG